MTNPYVERIMTSFPLLVGGIFMVYLAAADDAIFDFILNSVGQNKLTVSAATVAATAPLMFFAIGFIKQSILHEWQTIYQYERLLEKNIFWIMAIVLLISVVFLNIVEEGVHILNIHVLIGCVGFSVYLIVRARKTKSRQQYN